MIKDSRVVYGGGCSELLCSIAVNEAVERETNIEQYAIRAFADALEDIPLALAENSGYSAVETVTKLKSAMMDGGLPHLAQLKLRTLVA